MLCDQPVSRTIGFRPEVLYTCPTRRIPACGDRGTQEVGAKTTEFRERRSVRTAPARQLTPEAVQTNFVLRALFAYFAALTLVGALATTAAAQVSAAPAPAAGVGGITFGQGNPADTQAVAGEQAKILANGKAAAPDGAPDAVKNAIRAANAIVGKPYIYGGGHRSFFDRGYDCSGTISFALHGGDVLDSPLDSSSFMSWGERGRGDWVTIYTNPGHAFVVIAGLRLDTSAAGDPSGAKGPRWRPRLRSTTGFRARHPENL